MIFDTPDSYLVQLLYNEVVGGYIGFTLYTPRTTKLLGGILVSLRQSVCPACRVRSVTSTVLDGFFPY